MVADGIAIVNQATGQAWVFQFFPEQIDSSSQFNWKERDVTLGVMPLSYANTAPKQVNIREVWLDGTDKGESIEEDVRGLEELGREVDRGTPPPLLYIRGSEQLRVVLTQLDVQRRRPFTRQGESLRAVVSMTLKQHVRVERVTVRTSDPTDGGSLFGG